MDINKELELYKKLYMAAKREIDVRRGLDPAVLKLDILELESFGRYLDPEKQADMVRREVGELKENFKRCLN